MVVDGVLYFPNWNFAIRRHSLAKLGLDMRKAMKVGALTLFLGLFLLPLGYNEIFWTFLQLTNSYLESALLMYVLSIGLIIIGFSLLSRSLPPPLKWVGNPVVPVFTAFAIISAFVIILRGA